MRRLDLMDGLVDRLEFCKEQLNVESRRLARSFLVSGETLEELGRTFDEYHEVEHSLKALKERCRNGRD